MSESDRANVRVMLMAARFRREDIDWMVASCPSIERCKALCKQPDKWWMR